MSNTASGQQATAQPAQSEQAQRRRSALKRQADPFNLVADKLAGRFAVVRYLGNTSSCAIYRAVHTIMERPCFLKVAPRDPDSSDGMLVTMRREIQATAKVQHGAVLRNMDGGVSGAWAYLAQEWSDGPNLRALMDQRPQVSIPDMLAIALQLLDALAALHRQGVILRAFDPSRILVPSQNSRVHLRLFDLGRVAYVGETPDASQSVERVVTGFKMRDTRYVAPEEITEAAADPRSDLYSLGVLLYEMITGEYPYVTRGQGPSAYISSHLVAEPRPITVGPSQGVPEDLPDILRRLLAKDPGDRFETAEAARRAVEDVVVPELLKFQGAKDKQVLESWRRRVRNGLQATEDAE
jgi:eukaryotic-like serine/threonine-protein kinase